MSTCLGGVQPDRQRPYAGTMSGTGSLALGQCLLNLTGNNTFTGGTTVSGRHAGGERQPGERRHGGRGRHAGRQRHHHRPGRQRGHPCAGQLDRHAEHQRQLHAGRRRHLPGRGQRAGQADRINATGTATLQGGTVQVLAQAGQLRQQHDLHHPQRHRRRQRHLRRRHQQLRLPHADAGLRRQQRVPHPGAAPQNAFTQLRRP